MVKTIKLSRRVYDLLKSIKREDETFDSLVSRLLDRYLHSPRGKRIIVKEGGDASENPDPWPNPPEKCPKCGNKLEFIELVTVFFPPENRYLRYARCPLCSTPITDPKWQSGIEESALEFKPPQELDMNITQIKSE